MPGRRRGMVRVGGRLGIFGRLRADLALRGDPSLAIPDRVFRPQWRELDPYVGLERLSWRGGSLRIEGWADVPSVDIGRRRDATKLPGPGPRGKGRPPLVLPARAVRPRLVGAAFGPGRHP